MRQAIINQNLQSEVEPSPTLENPIQILEPSPTVEVKKCVVEGCSGQLCVDQSKAPVFTTCEMKLEYGCYAKANCILLPDNSCGWEQTQELRDCLDGLNGRN